MIELGQVTHIPKIWDETVNRSKGKIELLYVEYSL